VWILFGLETLSFAFVLYEMMQGAGIHCLSCIPLSLSTLTLPTWSFEVISILTGLSKRPRSFLRDVPIDTVVTSLTHGAWILLLEDPCYGSFLVYTYFRHGGMCGRYVIYLATNIA
jgi:hypothetical protein